MVQVHLGPPVQSPRRVPGGGFLMMVGGDGAAFGVLDKIVVPLVCLHVAVLLIWLKASRVVCGRISRRVTSVLTFVLAWLRRGGLGLSSCLVGWGVCGVDHPLGATGVGDHLLAELGHSSAVVIRQRRGLGLREVVVHGLGMARCPRVSALVLVLVAMRWCWRSRQTGGGGGGARWRCESTRRFPRVATVRWRWQAAWWRSQVG